MDGGGIDAVVHLFQISLFMFFCVMDSRLFLARTVSSRIMITVTFYEPVAS